MPRSNHLDATNSLIESDKRIRAERAQVQSEIAKLKLQVDLFNYECGGKRFWCKTDLGRAVVDGKTVTFTRDEAGSAVVETYKLPSFQKAILKSLNCCLGID